MAKILKIDPEKHKTDLCDSATNESCITEKVVDITEDCPKRDSARPAILVFTRAKRGVIVQTRFAGHVHFFVDELDQEMDVASDDDTFGSRAEMVGLTKVQLLALIKEHAPTSSV